MPLKKLTLICMLAACPAFGAMPYTVVIDPGHGGVDAGAVRDIFKESEITLKVAEKMASLLRSDLSRNLNVILTRETNKSLSLENRVQVAEKNNADLFISLHANSSKAQYVKGMEFYFKKGLSPSPRLLRTDSNDVEPKSSAVKRIIYDIANFGNIRQSLKFNQMLQNQMKSSLNSAKTVIKRAPFFVIEKTSMPAALIEIGYISNLSEAKLLLTEERQQQIAETIAKSIFEYFDTQDHKDF